MRTALSWALLAAFYLLLAGQVSPAEAGAAVLAAAAAAALARSIRRGARRQLQLLHVPLRVLGRAAWALVRDTGRVAIVLLARPGGRAITEEFDAGGQDPRSAGRRALVTLTGSLAPNSFVLALEPRRILMHCLSPQPSQEGQGGDREWPA
jgi:multisubunit Na+/H+ antiporter MnhE subunit